MLGRPRLQKHANQMVAHYSEVLYYADSLRSLDDVHETFAGQLTVEDVNIILRYLHDSGVVEFDQKRGVSGMRMSSDSGRNLWRIHYPFDDRQLNFPTVASANQ